MIEHEFHGKNCGGFNENRTDDFDVLDGHGFYDFDYDAVDRALGNDLDADVEDQFASASDSIRETFYGVANASRISPTKRSFESAGRRWDIEADAMRKSGNWMLVAFAGSVEKWLAKQAAAQTNQYNRSREYSVGKCIIALAWVVNPGLFDGSLRSLSKEFGVSAFTLSAVTSDASRCFGIANRTRVFNCAQQARRRALEEAEEAPRRFAPDRKIVRAIADKLAALEETEKAA